MNRIKLTHGSDLDNGARGLVRHADVRTVELDAAVDPEATMLQLPADVVGRLGLPLIEMRKIRRATGEIAEVACVGNIVFEVLGRRMSCDALVLPAGATPLIGRMQLAELDLILDAETGEVRVNPESPDMPLIDLLHAG